MKKRLSIAAVYLFAGVAFGQGPKDLLTSPLPPELLNQEVFIQEVTVRPGGGSAPVHRHDAFLYAYMLEGTLETQVQGGELQRVTKGQIFTENPDDTHVLMRNVSATEPARFLVFYIKKAGAPAGRLVENTSE